MAPLVPSQQGITSYSASEVFKLFWLRLLQITSIDCDPLPQQQSICGNHYNECRKKKTCIQNVQFMIYYRASDKSTTLISIKRDMMVVEGRGGGRNSALHIYTQFPLPWVWGRKDFVYYIDVAIIVVDILIIVMLRTLLIRV